MTNASLPGLSLDQRVPQAFALLLTEANALHIRDNATVAFIDILQRCVHELRRADDHVLIPFPGDTVVRRTLTRLLQVGIAQVLRAEGVVFNDGSRWHSYQAEQQGDD